MDSNDYNDHIVIEGRTYLTLRDTADALNADVEWNEYERKVEISNDEPKNKKGVYFMNSKPIDSMSPMSGRAYKNDGSVVNIADLLDNIVNSGVTNPEHTKLNVVGSGTASFEANDAANTSKTITIVPTTSFSRSTRLLVQNPSTKTDLTVKVGFMWEGKTYFADWYTIPKKQTGADGVVMENHVRLLPPLSPSIKIYVSNDQAITTNFDTTCIIQEV